MCNGSVYSYADQQVKYKESRVVADYFSGISTTPQLEFVELPFETYGNNTMGAIATLPSTWPGGSKLFGCILEAYVLLRFLNSGFANIVLPGAFANFSPEGGYLLP